MRNSSVAIEPWKIAGAGFAISRETKTDAWVVTVTLEQDGHTAMGECVPLKRYHHTPEQVQKTIQEWLAHGYEWRRDILQKTLAASPARFALDTALWHLEAAMTSKEVWELAGLPRPRPVATVFTLSGASPETMQQTAREKTNFARLKIKLMGDGLDADRVRAIHAAVPDKELLVDANESLSLESLRALVPIFQTCGVVMIEQPLPQADDEALRGFASPIPFSADESCHTLDDLPRLQGLYGIVNIKLDKSGGLTHGLAMAAQARQMGFKIMVGCMASTSLSIYPAYLLAQQADYADLDGALLLERDRPNCGIAYRGETVFLL